MRIGVRDLFDGYLMVEAKNALSGRCASLSAGQARDGQVCAICLTII